MSPTTLDARTLEDARDVVIAALADAGGLLADCPSDLGGLVGTLCDGAEALHDLGYQPGLQFPDPTSAAVRRTVERHRDQMAAVAAGPDGENFAPDLERAQRVLAGLVDKGSRP